MERDYILVKGYGPILITAPHTIKTNRYYLNDRNTKIHNSEKFIYKILMKIYKKLGRKNCTIMTWNRDKIKHIIPEDPNYTNNLDTSLWFNNLKKIRKRISKCVLHIDLHGMRNITSKNNIELGVKALRISNSKLYKDILMFYVVKFKNVENYNGFL